MKRILLLFFLLILIAIGIWYYYVYEKKQESNVLILYGNVDVRQVDLGFRVNGRVNTMPFQEGDFVRKGSLMAELDDQPYLYQVQQATAQRNVTKVNLANSEKLLKRRQELIKDGSVSQEDLENAESSRDAYIASLAQTEANLNVSQTNLEFIKLYAPADGVILTRIREPGTAVREADAVYTLTLVSPVWIRAFIAEAFLGVVYPGMPAEVFTDTENGKIYKGHVGFISPVSEFTPKTVETTQLRTDLVYRLRIICDNPDGGLRQGMPVTVRLHPKETQPTNTEAPASRNTRERKPGTD
jgi:HlyD family secretion protein